jgi:hypothetical protein
MSWNSLTFTASAHNNVFNEQICTVSAIPEKFEILLCNRLFAEGGWVSLSNDLGTIPANLERPTTRST